MQDIYVATRTIEYGEEITDADIALMPWPVQALPEGFFDEGNPLNADGAELRVALRPIEKNEALMKIKVSEPGADAGLTSRLERGQRAFAIKVDVASGVSGFLRPNDRVWVIDSEDKLEIRPVELARAGVDEAVVTSGLSVGERVCTSNMQVVTPGLPVRVAGAAPRSGSAGAATDAATGKGGDR